MFEAIVLTLMLGGIFWSFTDTTDASETESDTDDFASDGDDLTVDPNQVTTGDETEDLTIPPVDIGEDTTNEPPVEDLDLGATITEMGDGRVQIELGEDETGTLLQSTVYRDGGGGTYSWSEIEAVVYLLPEGAELPTGIGGGSWTATEFEAALDDIGAVELGRWDVAQTGWENDYDGDLPYSHFRLSGFELVTDAPTQHTFFWGQFMNEDPEYTDEMTDFADRWESVIDQSGSGGGYDGASTIGVMGVDELRGHEGDDHLFATSTGEVHGNAGDDEIQATDTETVFGGSGDDTIHGIIADEPNRLGWDFAWEGPAVVNGGTGDDTIIATGIIDGGDGDDTIATGGHSTLVGGEGIDTFMVSTVDVGSRLDANDVRLTDLGVIQDFDPTQEQLVILAPFGDEPTPVGFENNTLTLQFADGEQATLTLVGVDTLDLSTIAFADIADFYEELRPQSL